MSNQSEDQDDEEEDEDDEVDKKDDYVAAVCQYTTVLKETPPGFDDKKYEVNYMNMEKGSNDEIVERNMARKCSKNESVLRISEDEDRMRKASPRVSTSSQRDSSERLIEYCDDDQEGENEDAQLAVSGKLAIHLDTGETSREFCLNRLDEASSARTHTRDER